MHTLLTVCILLWLANALTTSLALGQSFDVQGPMKWLKDRCEWINTEEYVNKSRRRRKKSSQIHNKIKYKKRKPYASFLG